MADLLNQLNCGSETGNTGNLLCDIEPGLITGFSLQPRGDYFTAEQREDSISFVQAIQDKLLADNPSDRMYYFGPFVEVSPNGEAAVVQTYGYGLKRQVRRGTISFEFTCIDGKFKHAEQLKFKNRSFDAYLHDSTDNTWGAIGIDADGAEGLYGYRVSNFYVGDYEIANGQTGGQWKVTIEFTDSSALQERFGFVHTEYDPFAGGTGFFSVKHKATSSGPTNLSVEAYTATDNLINLYRDELAQTGTGSNFAFLVKNAEPNTPNYGNVITISSVTATGNKWVVTLAATATDPDNPGTGKKVSVEVNAPSVLKSFTNPVLGLTTPKPLIVTLG